jgi:hypothetical protein
LNTIIASPSRIGPTGASSASTITIGLMNSSVTAASFDHRVVGELGPLPPLVAIHRIVAAGDRRDPRRGGAADPVHGAFEIREIANAAGRRRIAAVGDCLHEHTRNAPPCRQLDQRVQVTLMAVHAAVRHQADQVQRLLAAGSHVHRRRERGVLEEVTVADALVDAGEVLIDHPAGAHVHVADFGIAHLAGRQADGLARRDQLRAGVALRQPVVDRGSRQLDRVVFAFLADAPAVEDDQDEWRRHRVASALMAALPA